jgi:integrase
MPSLRGGASRHIARSRTVPTRAELEQEHRDATRSMEALLRVIDRTPADAAQAVVAELDDSATRGEARLVAARQALQDHDRRQRVQAARQEFMPRDGGLTFNDDTPTVDGDATAARTQRNRQEGGHMTTTRARVTREPLTYERNNGRSFFRDLYLTRMTDIAPADVAKYVTTKEAAGLAGKTIGAHLNVLSAVFDYATRHLGLASTNPVAALDRVERPSGARKRDPYVLTPSELTRLLAALEDGYRLIFELAAQTGARVNEALGFAWEDIDLDGMTVSFTHQLQDKRREPLKTKASKATLEIAPSLVAKLRAHKLASARSGPSDLVFTGRRGQPLDDYNVSYRVMGNAAKKAGIVVPEDKRLSFHCLRHGFGSQLIADGADIAEVQALMRHESATTTLSVYTHEFDVAARSAERRARLERLYGDASEMPARASTAAHRDRATEPVDLARERARRTA